MSMGKEGSVIIQGMQIGRGNAVSPYTVSLSDSIVEFTSAGDVTITPFSGAPTTTTVLAGGRYVIRKGTATITFDGTFSIG